MDQSSPAPDDAVEIPITDELDLHTFRPAEVQSLLHDYLGACRERGILRVRIVHGKGTGALRATVHATLSRIPWVEGYALAPADRGHWGATVVELAPLP
jgi:DNA-nicking Smr family endonuclease